MVVGALIQGFAQNGWYRDRLVTLLANIDSRNVHRSAYHFGLWNPHLHCLWVIPHRRVGLP